MSRPRAIPSEDLALAHELRQEYGMPWKLIARLTGYEQSAIYGAVYRALARG